MRKVIKFINDNSTIILLCVLLLILMRTCGINSNIEKKNDLITSRLDSINHRIELLKTELNVKIEIEGLRSEGRQLDAIDRNLYDIERQNQVKKEIKILEDKLNK